jgi:hypothetical protein
VKFDAYAGNVRGHQFHEVVGVLEAQLQGTACRGKPMRRYGEVVRIEQAGHCAVWIGEDQRNECIYFEGKGESSPELAAAVRQHFEHTVSRGDVAEDFDEPGAFEKLQAIVRAYKGERVKAGFVALPDDLADGRTWAAGRRGGVAYTRVYEAGKHPDRLHLGRPNWARAELEVRPHYARDKQAAASMTPAEFWGFAGWTKAVGEALMNVEVPRFEPARRDQSFDRTTEYICRAFGKHLREMLADLGDPVCVWREFEAVWQKQEREDIVRRAMKGRTSPTG